MNDFYHDVKRNLLIYPLTPGFPVQALRQAIPESAVLDNKYFALPRSLRNLQIMRYLNFPVTPIIDNYDWPIEPGKTPLAHQKAYANFAVLHRRMFNLGSPGTMKTLSHLWAADWLMQQHPEGTFRALIVAPLSVLETVWAAGIFRNFLGRRSYQIILGTADKRRQLFEKPVDFALINHDGIAIGAHTRGRLELDGLSKDIAQREDIKLIIVDEARAFGDAGTDRNRIARQVIAKRPYLQMITGTPTPNKPTDAYGMAKLVNNAFGKSFQTFQSETMIKVATHIWKPKKDGYEQARRILVPAIRFGLEEIWDAPPTTTQQRMVDLTDEQKKLMQQLKRDFQVIIKSGQPISTANEAAARHKFIQISLGAVYDEDHNAHPVDATPRYKEMDSIIENAEHKVLVFCPLTSIVHILHNRWKKKWKTGFINGEVPAKKRPAIIRAFESEKDFKVLVVDPQATAHGINEFVCADTAIWAGATDKAELWEQGNRRLNRPGQKHPTTIYQIVSNPVEKEIFARLEGNTSMQGLMLDAIRKGVF